MSELLIENGTIVNRGEMFVGYLLTKGERIVEVGQGDYSPQKRQQFTGQRIDAERMLVIPGVIDDQVHFREPGLTHKGDIQSESIAAVAGGITSYMEMPNTVPATVTLSELEQKMERASESSVANYSFYLGATNTNIKEIRGVDPRTVCGVKVFMGSSTGDMLVDEPRALARIFAESPILVATHCESEQIIRDNSERFRAKFGEQIQPTMHRLIRSAEACYRSSAEAVRLADRYGTALHVLHISTERELSLFDSKPLEEKLITNEVCVHHLWFSDADYLSKGNLIKWNPAIKINSDRMALRRGVCSGKVDVIATDHAPHTLTEKARPYWECPSGAPMVQHSLVAMLELSISGVITVRKVVEKMCHAPALRFGIEGRGFLDEGAFADIVIVAPHEGWRVEREGVLYKCGWSPLEGEVFHSAVEYTIINGTIVNKRGEIDRDYRGSQLQFSR